MFSSRFTPTQKQLLENRRKNLMAQYEATFNQRENTVNEGDKIPLANQLRQLETEIKEISAQLLSLEMDEAQHLERNQAYPEALAQWQKIQTLAPDDIQVSQAIQDVEENLT